MSPLEERIEQARRAYDAQRYPGDLATEVMSRRPPTWSWALPAAAIILVVAALRPNPASNTTPVETAHAPQATAAPTVHHPVAPRRTKALHAEVTKTPSTLAPMNVKLPSVARTPTVRLGMVRLGTLKTPKKETTG